MEWTCECCLAPTSQCCCKARSQNTEIDSSATVTAFVAVRGAVPPKVLPESLEYDACDFEAIPVQKSA
jgi:hypothetical protein